MLLDFDQVFLKRELKILPNFSLWGKEETTRFLALLRIPEQLQTIVLEGPLGPIHKLSEKAEPFINQTNYFPYFKLKTILNYLADQNDEEVPLRSLKNDWHAKYQMQSLISQEIVETVKNKIDKLAHSSEALIIEFSNFQISNLLRQCELNQYAQAVKKYNLDGFALVCTLVGEQAQKQLMNYFSDSETQILLTLSLLFTACYYRQMMIFQRLPFLKRQSSMSDSVGTEIVESSDMGKKISIQEAEIDLGNYMLASTQTMEGMSEMGMSEIGQSEMGYSEMGQSEYGESVRGSFLPQSVYDFDNRGSVDCRMSFRLGYQGRASLMYDDRILAQLKNASMSLPFDLHNLEPLQTIRLRSLVEPFKVKMGSEHWNLDVKGAKFGRDKDNQFHYPDQMSISNMHASIFFRNDSFYLQDLGSKTGTYLLISDKIIVQDQLCVQFPPEVEIVLKVCKRGGDSGTIKVQIKKPQNFPVYKISLKQGHKIRIGRNDKSQIQINVCSLAPKHFEIIFQAGNFIFSNCQPKLKSWHRLSLKSIKSEPFKLKKGDIFRLSSKKSFLIEDITNRFSNP